MNITNTIRLYAECISSGAITEPTGGTWMSAICIYEGTNTPLNGSWLQRHCDNLGIVVPANGSFLQALANYYNEFEPINGTWANAVLVGCNAAPVGDLVWNTTFTEWQDETQVWKAASAPAAPTNDGGTFTTKTPTFTGTGVDGNIITLEVDGTTYIDIPVAGGVWSFQVTELLGGSPSPGTSYTVTTVQRDPATGLTSAEDQTAIFIISTTTSVTFDLFDSYGDGWNNGWMKLQQEIAGVFTDVDLPNYQTYGAWNNAAYNGTFQTYYNKPGYSTGTTGMIFEQYDPLSAPANSAARSWLQLIDTYIFDLDPADYRLVSVAPGSFTTERSVTVKETVGGATLATVPTNANWGATNVLATFTIS